MAGRGPVECREGKAEYCLQINVKATYRMVERGNGKVECGGVWT